MIAVIFEVEPAEGQETAYLDIAAELRSRLDRIEGSFRSSGTGA